MECRKAPRYTRNSKVALSIFFISIQLLAYSQDFEPIIEKITVVTLWDTVEYPNKMAFHIRTTYEIPPQVDVCIESSLMKAKSDTAFYLFSINREKICGVCALTLSDSKSRYSRLYKKHLSDYTSLDSSNQIISFSEIWVDKEHYKTQLLYLQEAPLCYDTYKSSPTPRIQWQIYYQSKADYTPYFMEETDITLNSKHYPKWMPGMDTTIKYFPILHNYGITDPGLFQSNDQEMLVFYQNNNTAKASKTEKTIILQGKEIAIDELLITELAYGGYYEPICQLDRDHSYTPDPNVILKINKTEKDITFRTNKDFQELFKDKSKLNDSYYTIIKSKRSSEYELRALTPYLNDGDDVEIHFKYSYVSEENFTEKKDFKTEFSYQNTGPLNFYYSHKISFQYPKGQILIEYDTSFCDHKENDRSLNYEYTSIKDIHPIITFTYQDKNIRFFKIWRCINPTLAVLLMACCGLLYIFRSKISQKKFIHLFSYTLLFFGFIAEMIYYTTFSGLESNFSYRDSIIKSYGHLLIIPLLLWLTAYFIELVRNAILNKE